MRYADATVVSGAPAATSENAGVSVIATDGAQAAGAYPVLLAVRVGWTGGGRAARFSFCSSLHIEVKLVGRLGFGLLLLDEKLTLCLG